MRLQGYTLVMNSKQKGKRGELEAAKILKDLGIGNPRRAQQYAGVAGSSDIVGVPGLAIEVKRQERASYSHLVEWIKQASSAASGDQKPIVLHRKSRSDWLVTLKVKDLPAVAAAVVLSMEQTAEQR